MGMIFLPSLSLRHGCAVTSKRMIWMQLIIHALISVNLCVKGPYIVHYTDIIMSAMTSQITSLSIVGSTVYSGADQRKHKRSASLAFVRRIHQWPVNPLHKGRVIRKMFPFDEVIMDNTHFVSIILQLECFLEVTGLHDGVTEKCRQ